MEAARPARMRDMRIELENIDRQMAEKQEQEAKLRVVIDQYQQQLAAVPTRESELLELTRDHATLLELYTSLLAKKENARMAMNMERRQIGEQFRIVDPARVPERPFSPNRQQLYAVGVLGGFAVGLGLVVLLTYRDHSLRSEADVVSVLSLPVIAMVPSMMSSTERHRARTNRWLSVGAAASAVISGAVVFWVFLR
jgi:capsular polysaccharide biosynthesis protein